MPYHVESFARRRRWLATRDFPLIWRSWDVDEYIVYSTASGDTHLLNEVAAQVLRQLERSELSVSDLTRDLATSFDTEFDRQSETYVENLLEYLDQIGLVESSP